MHLRARPSLLPALLFRVLGTAGLLSISGCMLPPDRVSWKSDDKTVEPQADGTRGSGRLVVETVYLGIDEGLERRERYYLYADTGHDRPYHTNNQMTVR